MFASVSLIKMYLKHNPYLILKQGRTEVSAKGVGTVGWWGESGYNDRIFFIFLDEVQW